MPAPSVINGDFSIPALAPGASVVSPTDPGVGWTWDPGHVSNVCSVNGPGAAGWDGQYLVLRANNGSSIVATAYQDLTFDGTPIRLKLRAARLSGGGRLVVTLGSETLISEAATGYWPAWSEFSFDVTPPAGVRRLSIGNRHFTGHNLGIADVRIESLATTTPGRLACLGPGRSGLVLTS